jgi:cation transporter-like permease
LLTTFSNGFEASDFGAAAAVSLIYLVVLFLLSACLAAAWTRHKGDFDPLLRIWSITLIVTWSASLTLLAFATFMSANMRFVVPFLGVKFDLVTHLVCNVFSSCLRTPPALTWQTFIIYLVYTSAALALIVYASRRFIPEKHVSGALGNHREPNIISVCIISAAIMTVFNTWTNSGIAIGIRNVLGSSN